MKFLDVLGGVTDVLGSLFNTGYNLYTNKRDFDYQKALQQEIFQREDTAVQRRMADLQAAGMNPNLAAGSSAQSGSVVARSNTNDVNIGQTLDSIQAVNQIRLQRQQTENAKIENQILKDTEYVKDNEKHISMANTLAALGIPFTTTLRVYPDNTFNINVGTDPDKFVKGLRYNVPGSISNIQKALDFDMQNLKNNAELLQRDVDFYTADKITGYLSALLPNVGFSFGKRFK